MSQLGCWSNAQTDLMGETGSPAMSALYPCDNSCERYPPVYFAIPLRDIELASLLTAECGATLHGLKSALSKAYVEAVSLTDLSLPVYLGIRKSLGF